MDTQRIQALEKKVKEAHSKLEGLVIGEEAVSNTVLRELFLIRDAYLNAKKEYYQKNGTPYKPAA